MRKIDLNDKLSRIERRLIIMALETCEWNKTKAADCLSINRTTLVEKMRRLGLALNRPSQNEAH